MLSRVAESLYWMARYIERAESTSRLLHVNVHRLLDADLPDHGRAWRELLLVVGRDDLYREHFTDYTAGNVAEFLLWHPANAGSVTACVARARENGRGVREQISSEMWEVLNRLHLVVSEARSLGSTTPHDLFVAIREGSHSFQGVAKATLQRGETYDFLELGSHLERADGTARLLAVKVPTLFERGPDAATQALLTEVLKACGAFEAFRKQGSDELRALRVVEYLLLDWQLPRAVAFCLGECLAATRSISEGASRPERAIGKIVAELSFAELPDPRAASTLLARVLEGIGEASSEVESAYFNTRVVLAQQVAQQQQ